ncbi:hypothetical protein ACFL08_04785 [Patescibacteria group bacterium]
MKKIKKSIFIFSLTCMLSGCSFSDVYFWNQEGVGNNEDMTKEVKKVITEELVELNDDEIADSGVLVTDGEKNFNLFGNKTVTADFNLKGSGSNIDSIAFWEAPDPLDTLMFVTAKSGDLIEVWKYPFLSNERSPIRIDGLPNGVAVDQVRNELLIGDARKNKVLVFALPSLVFKREFGRGVIERGETNLDILNKDGNSFAYVSQNNAVHMFNSVTGKKIRTISPPVSEIETVLVDNFYELIYIPEGQGSSGFKAGVYSYQYDGNLNNKKGSNFFGGGGIFVDDEEGIALYTCPSDKSSDNGAGFIIISEQSSPLNQFEFFNRQTWKHIGTLQIEGVNNTDGIAIFQKPLPKFPSGIFAAIDDDSRISVVSWEKVAEATGLSCD